MVRGGKGAGGIRALDLDMVEMPTIEALKAFEPITCVTVPACYLVGIQ